MSAVPPPTPPVRKFTPRNAPAAATPRPAGNSDAPALPTPTNKSSTISPSMEKKIDDLIRGSGIPSSTQQEQQQPVQQQQPQQVPVQVPPAPLVTPPQFDKDDIDALRKENKMLQTRVAAFFEFQASTQQAQNQDAPLNMKGMSEQEIAALMTLMRSRIRQLELALAWECSRREEAEERCYALLKRSVVTSS